MFEDTIVSMWPCHIKRCVLFLHAEFCCDGVGRKSTCNPQNIRDRSIFFGVGGGGWRGGSGTGAKSDRTDPFFAQIILNF